MPRSATPTQVPRERAFLVGIEIRGQHALLGVDDSLSELALLADTAGLQVVGETYQKIARPDPHTLIGSGKVVELHDFAEETLADVVIFDEELSPRQPVSPIDLTKDLQCPLLGLFGIEDTRPSPADAAKTEEALKKFGKTYEFHTYENAGHAFFAVDRPQYRVHAAVDGWKRVFAWYGKYLR